MVADKGYHSNATCQLRRSGDIRTYFREPGRGRRNWEGKESERKAVYANRRRIHGGRGKRLMRLRAEHCERNFTHLCESGGQRRTFLRGLGNIAKKLLGGAMGFNVSPLSRKVSGLRKPRQLGAWRWGYSPSYVHPGAFLRPTAWLWPLVGGFCHVFAVFKRFGNSSSLEFQTAV